MISELKKKIESALGKKEVDLLLINGKMVNVFSGEIQRQDVAIHRGVIAGFGKYRAKKTINLEGKYLAPGFIDGHLHLESAMVTPGEFARLVVPQGTTTLVIDPHEIANVLGIEGIKYLKAASDNIPLDIFVMLPSCVPATNLETSGARLESEALSGFVAEKRILGLGEMMNYPGVISCLPEVLKKITAIGIKRIDGHAPGVTGKELNAYISAGITSDHECTCPKEAKEKLEKGMYIMIREGGAAKNLKDLIPLVTKLNSRRCLLVTDDRHPRDILEEGHINFLVKKAIKLGCDPVVAIQMATINPAEYFRLDDRGAIAPGYRADFLIFNNFEEFKVEKVFKNGKLAAKNDAFIAGPVGISPALPENSIKIKSMNPKNLEIKAGSDSAVIKVIEIVPNQIVTAACVEKAKIENNIVLADINRDILKIAVIERHNATGGTGIGFVKGFGLNKGALASSVAHDSHNLIIVGTNDEDTITAVREIEKMQGGQVVVSDGNILASLALPIAGLISNQPMEMVAEKVENLTAAAYKLGCRLKDPFMTLSFLSLPVIPELKLTDKGLVDVTQFKIVSLFENIPTTPRNT